MPRARKGGGKSLLGKKVSGKSRVRGGSMPPNVTQAGDFSKQTDPVAAAKMRNELIAPKMLHKQQRGAQKAARGGLKLGKGKVR